ncbi:MAG: hypothetical protein C7B43_20425, partial [Sulfobacillus benefaciens]
EDPGGTRRYFVFHFRIFGLRMGLSSFLVEIGADQLWHAAAVNGAERKNSGTFRSAAGSAIFARIRIYILTPKSVVSRFGLVPSPSQCGFRTSRNQPRKAFIMISQTISKCNCSGVGA